MSKLSKSPENVDLCIRNSLGTNRMSSNSICSTVSCTKVSWALTSSAFPFSFIANDWWLFVSSIWMSSPADSWWLCVLLGEDSDVLATSPGDLDDLRGSSCSFKGDVVIVLAVSNVDCCLDMLLALALLAELLEALCVLEDEDVVLIEEKFLISSGLTRTPWLS